MVLVGARSRSRLIDPDLFLSHGCWCYSPRGSSLVEIPLVDSCRRAVFREGLDNGLGTTILFDGLGRGGAGDSFRKGLDNGLAMARLLARACSFLSSSPLQSLVNSARTPRLHCRTTCSKDGQTATSEALATAMTSSLSFSSHLNSAALSQYLRFSARRYGFATSW